MKKILFILFLLVPFFVYAEYDESKISIESVGIEYTNGLGRVVRNPNVNGMSINVYNEFVNLDDSIVYYFDVKNNSGEDIVVLASEDYSGYVDYYIFDPVNDYIVKNGTTGRFKLVFEYMSIPDNSQFSDGVVHDTKTISL